MKVVVIGSNAFQGQDFVDLLLDDPGRQVIGISRSPERALFLKYKSHQGLSRYRFHQLDLNKDADTILTLLDRERPDAIVNFAAQSEVGPSWEHPEHWFQTNTVSLAKMINHLRRKDYLKKYVHISSPEVYGNCVGRVLEDAPFNPSTPYSASKAAADMLLSVYQKNFGFPLVIVRSTNVYGPRQQLFKIIPRTVIYVRLGKRIQLHGGGVAVKSFIHVRDVSRGELAILERGRVGELYHLSPDKGVAIRDVVSSLCKKLGKRFEDAVDIVEERIGQDAAYIIDSAKARKEFGWAPQVSIDTGLSEVVSWMNANWAEVQKQQLEYLHKA